MTAEVRFPNFRAPQKNRQILCVPPWPAIRQMLPGQRDAISTSAVEILGVPLADLAREARRALIAQALAYTRSYTKITETDAGNVAETVAEISEGPLILTGHQPELIHPGVWLKTFAASQLAQQTGGMAINLVIDNDLCRAPSIRVPTGSIDQPQTVDLPFDQNQQEVPWEERAIADRSLWNSFGDRVTRALEPLVSGPLIALWWPKVLQFTEQTSQLGLAIAQVRHRLEQSWGCRSLEIPQSHICQTTPFRRFVLHLISHAARLRNDYNGALADYRQSHNLRSPAQPLPDLAEFDDWIETPFWIWTQENPTRRALFVQPSHHGLQLSDRQHWIDTLPLNQGSALQRLADWQQQGVKIRTRAIITTLYARLLLADTFIHGIGGAKYDQVTDALCKLFFGIELPKMVTMTGTLRLPIEHMAISPTRASEVRQSLRELRYHPESAIHELGLDRTHSSQVDTWVEQKKHWVRTAKSVTNAAQRHAQIVAANEGLQPWLQSQREQLEQELALTMAQTRANKILESRDYPFCLFPPSLLRDFLLDFSQHIP